MAYTAKDPRPPRHFLYLRETKSWRCEENEENVHLLTYAPARGVGKKRVLGVQLEVGGCRPPYLLVKNTEQLMFEVNVNKSTYSAQDPRSTVP